MSVRLSVCNNSAAAGRIFKKFDISIFLICLGNSGLIKFWQE